MKFKILGLSSVLFAATMFMAFSPAGFVMKVDAQNRSVKEDNVTAKGDGAFSSYARSKARS